MDLGSIGIWTAAFERQPASRVRAAAAELDELGYGALWFPEGAGREALTQASLLLHATDRLAVATGIAKTSSFRDPMAMAMAHQTLTEAFPERFLLGLGGHRSPKQPGINADPRPIDTMRDYLDAMDNATVHRFDVTPRRVLGALGPRALELAADKTDGAHTYSVPVEHTAKARQTLGPEPLLAVHQGVVLGSDRAAAVARANPGLWPPHYVNTLRRLGYTDDDLADRDRLADALFVVGDTEAIAKRVQEHLDAGASHVCIEVFTADTDRIPLAEWRELAGLIRRPAA